MNILVKGFKMNINREIGRKIKYYRKQKKITIDSLAEAIGKSSATVSKYENGHISMDIQTIYDIAKTLDIQIGHLIYHAPAETRIMDMKAVPRFFRDLNQFFLYYFDGRSSSLCRCVCDITEQVDASTFEVRLYMNIESYDNYWRCENTYMGILKHYDALSHILMENRDTEMDPYTLCIPASYLDADYKWGLDFGVSSRPLMPTSAKVLISKNIQDETKEFIEKLKVSKEDIRLLKQYNMFCII